MSLHLPDSPICKMSPIFPSCPRGALLTLPLYGCARSPRSSKHWTYAVDMKVPTEGEGTGIALLTENGRLLPPFPEWRPTLIRSSQGLQWWGLSWTGCVLRHRPARPLTPSPRPALLRGGGTRAPGVRPQSSLRAVSTEDAGLCETALTSRGSQPVRPPRRNAQQERRSRLSGRPCHVVGRGTLAKGVGPPKQDFEAFQE